MAASRPGRRRRRPRRGSLERPVNGRLYRGTCCSSALPLLLAAFTVARPAALPPPSLPPAFDGAPAIALAARARRRLPRPRARDARARPRRRSWFRPSSQPYGLTTEVERFAREIPGLGRAAPEPRRGRRRASRRRTIVVVAHRDDIGRRAGRQRQRLGHGGADRARPRRTRRRRSRARRRERRCAPRTPSSSSRPTAAPSAGSAPTTSRRVAVPAGVVAVINLDAIAGRGPPRLEFAGDRPARRRDARPDRVARIAEQAGVRRAASAASASSSTLAFPFTLYEQGRSSPRHPGGDDHDRRRPPARAFGDTPAA